MSHPAFRAVARRAPTVRTRVFARANSSSSSATKAASETASKASSAASSATSKAAEGLSRVTSSAGPSISNAAAGASQALGKIGGRTGRLIKFVESLIPPTIYYSRVGLELSKLVFKGRQMTPPSISVLQAYLSPLTRALSKPQTLFSSNPGLANPSRLLGQIRNMNTQQLVNAGVVTAEAIGFFTVGTMIGRMKIVGYRGDTGGQH
ncbi:MAG: hypothetical protein M1814_005247 [Vezdaea aestivalis]|nr:MAG: hypothetical protein M1814_005247 [Vezdaea aestivalis]